MASGEFDPCVVVIDNGTSECRAGFAGAEIPSTSIPTFVGYPKHRLATPGLGQEGCVGEEAQLKRGVLSLVYPIEKGVVTHWDDMERIWHYVYNHQLCVDSSQHPVLISEPTGNPSTNRQKMWEVLFETFQAPRVLVENQAVLAMYGVGRFTALLVVSGEGVTEVVPIYDGFVIRDAVNRQNFAGGDVTEQLRKLLKQNGCSLGGSSGDWQLVKEIKEKLSFVSLNALNDEETAASRGDHRMRQQNSNTSINLSKLHGSSSQPYELPDGRVIYLEEERTMCTEILFHPGYVGLEAKGLSHLIHDSIVKCPVDLRKEMFACVCLCGGNTLLPNLVQRVERDLQGLTVPSMRLRVKGMPRRDLNVWTGGSVLGSLGSFKSTWLDKATYNEVGAEGAEKILTR